MKFVEGLAHVIESLSLLRLCEKLDSGEVSKLWMLPACVISSLALYYARAKLTGSVYKRNISKIGEKYSRKLSNSFFYFIQYLILFTMSSLALRGIGFYSNKEVLLYPYPNKLTPFSLICYWLELSVYICSTAVLFNDPRKNYSDFKKLCFHHVFTISLIYISYSISFTVVGVLIMNLHDISDIFIEGGKSIKYRFGEKHTVPIFAMIIIIFTYTRGYYFSYQVIYYLITHIYSIPEMAPYVVPETICIICLCGLEVLDVMWIINLFQIVLYYLKNRKIDDIRDPDDIEKTKKEKETREKEGKPKEQ